MGLLKRIVSRAILTLLLIGISLAFNIQPVKASGTIYIRADGSIDPPTAPISTVENVTYVFTGNIYDKIVVQRSNIIIDGNGYTVQGTFATGSRGIYLSSVHNVTVKNLNVKQFDYGIRLGLSSNNNIFGNNLINNSHGIELYKSSNNRIYHNNFLDNGQQVYDRSWERLDIPPSINIWDDGYPSGGNYWSDYTGVDLYSGPYQDETGSDGIGDTPYVIAANNTDRYPLMNPWGAPFSPLKVSISPTSATILVGRSVTFTSTVTGGYTPYAYQWYLNGNPVSGATSADWTFTPIESGIYYVCLKVTDGKGNTAQSETARITVSAVPVGGYSILIQQPTTTKPVTPYITLLAILTAIFTTIRRKTKRKY